MSVHLRPARSEDGPAIAAIQAEGLASGHASFRADPEPWEDFVAAHPIALVAERAGGVAGWSALAATSSRCVYRGVGEVSTYVARTQAGQGLGQALLAGLIAESEAAGWWTLVAQIFPENTASLALHRRLGFRDLGTRERLGQMSYGPMAGQWRDVVLLERRSAVTGGGAERGGVLR